MKKKKKVVPKLSQEIKMKVDIVTSDDIKIYYTGKFQDFTSRYIIIMLINIGKSGEYDKERSKEWLVNKDPDYTWIDLTFKNVAKLSVRIRQSKGNHFKIYVSFHNY